VLSELVGRAKSLGFGTEKLIFVEHGEGQGSEGKGVP